MCKRFMTVGSMDIGRDRPFSFVCLYQGLMPNNNNKEY